MRPTTALATFRDYVNTAAVLPGGCHYRPESEPSARSGQLRLMSFERPEREADGQLWIVRAGLYLITPKLNDSSYDTLAVEELIVPVVDIFDASTNPAAFHLEVVGDHVNHCDVRVGFVDSFFGYVAFRLDIEIKLKRAAGSA